MRKKSWHSSHMQMPNRPPFMMSDRRGEVVGRWFDSVSQEVLFSKEATYQSPSKCQIRSRSQCPSASSGKRSQRCSPVGGQAEQGPVGRVRSSLNTAQTSERETLPCVGRVTTILFRLWVQCLLRLCMWSTECTSEECPWLLATPLIPWSNRDV